MSDNSLRTNYPMLFNTTEIPFPKSYSEKSQTVEKVRQAEAGNDIVDVFRNNKLKISMSFTCLQDTLETLASFEALDSFTFKRYSPRTGAYEERTVRMRDFDYSLKKGSEDLQSVEGVWDVSFKLIEF